MWYVMGSGFNQCLSVCQNIGADSSSVLVMQLPGSGTGGDLTGSTAQDASDLVAACQFMVFLVTGSGVRVRERGVRGMEGQG
jgi:hypothetical protein